jgi:hypothetical protein
MKNVALPLLWQRFITGRDACGTKKKKSSVRLYAGRFYFVNFILCISTR